MSHHKWSHPGSGGGGDDGGGGDNDGNLKFSTLPMGLVLRLAPFFFLLYSAAHTTGLS